MSDLLKDTATVKGMSVKGLIREAVRMRNFSNVEEIVERRYNDWVKCGIDAVPNYITDHCLNSWSSPCSTTNSTRSA